MSEFGILLLGSESCGKSLLLKSLQYFSAHGRVWDFGSIPKHGRPTLGVDLVKITFGVSRKSSGKRQNAILVRELGGQMAPLWSNYFASGQCDGLIYCIDAVNTFQASDASVKLARLLNDKKLRETAKRILIVFTKSADLQTPNLDSVENSAKGGALTVMELRNMMLLDDIIDESRPFYKSIDLITKCSAVTGIGLVEILDWIQQIGRE